MPDRVTILAATPKCRGCGLPMRCMFGRKAWQCRWGGCEKARVPVPWSRVGQPSEPVAA